MRGRLLIAAVGFALFAAGVIGWIVADTQTSFYSDRVDTGPLALWISLFLIFGPVLSALAVAIPADRSLLRWSAPLLFLLWFFQAAGFVSIYLAPAAQITYFDLSRQSSLSVGWWALGAFALAVIAVAMVLRWSSESPTDGAPGEAVDD